MKYACYTEIVPAKNSRKQYLENSYYHLYNRGVEKRTIFLDEQDYTVFISYLKQYLLPRDEQKLRERLSDESLSWIEKDKILRILQLNNFAEEVSLLAYCLMPNHFHFLIKQKSADSIDIFMNSLGTRYTMYFNRKYKRVGSLYQGVYKAVQVVHEEQLLYLTKYIHKQILSLQGEALRKYSSYRIYLGEKCEWVKPDEVLFFFSKINRALSYQSFVEETDEMENIEEILLEEE